MSETTWGAETEPAPKKKTIPTWLWFCGGGCLGAVILSIIIGTWLVQKAVEVVNDAKNPEVQWPKVAAILPFDERPKEITSIFGMPFMFPMFILQDSRGYVALVMATSGKNAEDLRRTQLNPDFKGGFAGQGEREELKPVEVTVQGRTLKGVRFFQKRAGHRSDNPESGASDHQGHSIVLDVTPPGRDGLVLLQLVRTVGQDPISDEEVQAFLKPFHVGDKR